MILLVPLQPGSSGAKLGFSQPASLREHSWLARVYVFGTVHFGAHLDVMVSRVVGRASPLPAQNFAAANHLSSRIALPYASPSLVLGVSGLHQEEASSLILHPQLQGIAPPTG